MDYVLSNGVHYKVSGLYQNVSYSGLFCFGSLFCFISSMDIRNFKFFLYFLQFVLIVSEYSTELPYDGNNYVTDEFATETFTDIVTTTLPEYETEEPHGNNTIYVTGLFPLSHEVKKGSLGRGVTPAMKLAFDKVNRDPSILPGLTLKSRQFDTKVSNPIHSEKKEENVLLFF